MEHQEKIRVQLRSLPETHQQRIDLLTCIFGAYERGGSEEVDADLAKEMTRLAAAFDEKLAELRKLL